MPLFRLEKSDGDDMSKGKLVNVPETNLELERHLEDWLENSPWVLIRNSILWIGRQASATDEDGTIYSDLFGVDSNGNIVVAELKKGRTPRDTLAQLLDYAVWADRLSESDIRDIAETYFETRDEFKGKTFDEAFKEVFDLPETDEIPPLNQSLRLFIVAEEIPLRMERVCQFLRTSHDMDISCIDISTFKTESDEILVSVEAKVGNTDSAISEKQEWTTSQDSLGAAKKSTKDVLWEVVQELTQMDSSVVFTQKNILEKHPELNANTLRRVIIEECANRPPPNDNITINSDGKYWWVTMGKYRLYDPEKDKIIER